MLTGLRGAIMRLVLLVVLPLTLSARSVPAQDSTFRVVSTVDDITGRQDTRIIIRGAPWPPRYQIANPDGFKGATLVIACGDRLPSDSGRTLILFAGQALEPFGAEYAYAEARLDAGTKPQRLSFAIFDYGDVQVVPTGGHSGRQLAFIGTDHQPYFSAPFFTQLLRASSLRLTYRVIGEGSRTVTFAVAGLRSRLDALTRCSWPQ
jgi:hypothetical protein